MVEILTEEEVEEAAAITTQVMDGEAAVLLLLTPMDLPMVSVVEVATTIQEVVELLLTTQVHMD